MRFRRFRVLFGQKARYFRKGVNLNFPLAALIVVIFEGTNDSWEPLSQVQRRRLLVVHVFRIHII